MQGTFLGKIYYTAATFSRLQPVAKLEGKTWEAIEDPDSLFPGEGRVFCLESGLTTAPKDSVWMFSVRRNPRQGTGPDEYLAENLEPAVPIVDLTDLSLESARRQLYEVGVTLPPLSQGLTCVLFTENCYERFRLAREDTSALWRATPSIELVSLLRAVATWKNSIEINGFRYLPPRIEAMPSQVVRRVDWSADADFVGHVLNRFRRLGQHFADTEYALPAKNAVAFVTRALRESGVLPDGDEGFAQINERLRAQWPLIQGHLADAYDFRDLILESKPAQQIIERAKAQARADTATDLRAELEPQVRREIESELGSLQRGRDRLLDEIDEQTKRLDAFRHERDEVEALCASTRKALNSLKSTLGAELAGIRESLRDLSAAELPFARTVVARLEEAIGITFSKDDVPLLPSAIPPWGVPMRSENSANRHVTELQLGDRLKDEAEAHGIDPIDLVAIDAFTRAGELVLLLGDAAENALRAYARCVTGGVVRAMSLDPSCIGLDDLWRTAGDHLPTAFAHAWLEARATPAVTVLVCLRGLDSSPFQLWLAALESVLRSPERPQNLLITATVACTPDQAPTKHPFSTEMSKRLIPLRPGTSSDACFRALDAIEGDPSVLVSEKTFTDALGNDFLRIVMGAGGKVVDPKNVMRALRVATTAAPVCGKEVAVEFAGTWLRSTFDKTEETELPPVLQHGHEMIERLNFHH